ncbi:MAG: hypothetical protein H5U02_01430 [Clostridia bacterium]|nr:hypothetical protein [Clostridia bacterium]
MDVSGRRIWHVSAGDEDRHWADLCLEWDVILNGPGSEGPWPGCLEPLRSALETLRLPREFAERKLSDLHRFCEEVQDGDIVVLRAGTSDVYGVGVVAGGYIWHEEFRDIDGWDYGHVRRVRWLWRYGDAPRRFARHTLRPGDTVQVMDAKPVLEWLESLSVDPEAWRRPLRDLPAPSRDLELDEISGYLLKRGVDGAVVERLPERVGEVLRLVQWYGRNRYPSEVEATAHLVVPLLRALGWTPEKTAVNWEGADVALFASLPREEGNLAAVVEVKPYDEFFLVMRSSEAKTHAGLVGEETCSRLIVTNGWLYGVYLKKDGIFGNRPDAYLNLTRMRDAYPVLDCRGAKDALLYMAAEWA